MDELVADRISWSIRVGRDEHGGRVFQQLTDLIPELLAHHYPPSCGYEAHGTRLGGPLEGVRWTVTRGAFRGELDVQRYDRAGAERASPCAVVLRLVASAGMRETSAIDTEALERRVVTWAMVGWGMGSVALGTLLLGVGGVVPAWAQALALVPAVAAWRASVASLVRRAGAPMPALEPTHHQPAALTASAPTGPTGPTGPAEASEPAGPAKPTGPTDATRGPTVGDGLRRWRELLPALAAQRELLQASGGQAPFRKPGHLEAAHGTPRDRVRQALAAASSSLTWSRPVLAAVRDPSDRARGR